MVKGFTVRLSDEDAPELEAVARVDGVPFATIDPARYLCGIIRPWH
jgi:hypothetical protein